MATMAMATVRKINYFRSLNALALFFWCISSPFAITGEWEFSPSFGIEETYTDNVELTITEPTSSIVSQAVISLDTEYQSRLASFSFTGEGNNVFYSHDNEFNDSFLTLNAKSGYFLWISGPELFANATISNTNRNIANNGIADLISGDTIQAEYYSTGLRYNIHNNNFSIASSLIYSINEFEDNIGEHNGVTAALNSRNGNSARIAFWQLKSEFSTNHQDFSGETRTGEQYNIDAMLGVITPYKFNPFIRFYDEDFSGESINQNQQTTSSWGPGIRWLVSQHLTLDLSYNYVEDETVGDDYIAASMKWQPSARTSLEASYNKRFFGNSYNLNFQHRTKRLTNTINYNENIEMFDRNNYEQVDVGIFWCPTGVVIKSISQCFVQSEAPTDGEFQLGSFFALEPIESNEFSLNKSFNWVSKLQLARTSFAIKTSASRQERLESKVIDDTLDISLTIDRKISGRSNLTFLAKFDYLIFDKDNPEGSRQEDHYRTLSATYTKDLASSLSTHFTLQHVNRDSNVEQYSYNEVRAIINVTKEF